MRCKACQKELNEFMARINAREMMRIHNILVCNDWCLADYKAANPGELDEQEDHGLILESPQSMLKASLDELHRLTNK